MLMPPRIPVGDRIDVDFSLAIHNRTGKYFIGHDLLEMDNLPIGDTYYWARPASAPPAGLVGRIIGRLQHEHIKAHALGGAMRVVPRRRSARPLLHLDPFTVPSTVLRRQDAVLCHDLGPITHPRLFDPEVCRIYDRIYAEIARVGPHMIFVSEASRREFTTYYTSSPASSRCIYPAIRMGVTHAARQAVAGVTTPFLLTVGSVGDRKNQQRCIKAYACSGLAAAGVGYVLCGGKEPGFEEVRALADATPGVVRLGYVSDAELSWLYAEARGFVLVSLLEGFGMPVAEAIARGLVPLVTRGSVLQEVAGDGALLADADDASDIATAMLHLARMSDVERGARMTQLMPAIARFDLAVIRDQWRTAIGDILASARLAGNRL